MNISRFTTMLCALAAPFVASAQISCPADPLQKLNGQTWVFETHSSNYQQVGSAAIGRFTASVVNGQGVLSVTETVNDSLNISRLATASGRYQVYENCTGGELMFMLNGYAAKWEFVFVSNTELYLVTDYLAPRYSDVVTLTGTAKLAATPACPAGVNPLQTLVNSTWVLQTLNSQWQGFGSGSVGFYNPFIVNGQGFLTAVETVNNAGVISRLAPESGRFQVYADCSGGEIMLMNRKDPVQFEFVFTSNNLDEMFMINDSISSSYTILVGLSKKRNVTIPCPADPLTFLAGSTFSFQVRASNFENNQITGNSAAAIGRFTPSIVNGRGVLTGTETYRDFVTVNRLVDFSGRYQVYPDCSGGELIMSVNGFAVQYEFVVEDNNTLRFVSDYAAVRDPFAVLVGTALRNAPTACPAGVSPLGTINGTSWAFRTFAPSYIGTQLPRVGSASVGVFKPTIINGAGVLTAVETINNAGEITRLAQETGRYIIYPDCSGGEIMLMNRNRPVQLEFVFNGGGFNDMFLLSDTNADPFGLTLLQGRARRQ